jgi:hypothetical protein
VPTDHDATFRGALTAVLERQAGAPDGGLVDALGRLLRPAGQALPVEAARHREAWDSPGTGTGADRAALDDIVRRAEADLSAPWGVPLASAASRVHRDGDRDEWEGIAFARQRRLSRAAVTAAATLDDRWIDEVADGVQLLCEQSSWCWPAHDDAMRTRGSILATVGEPFLDLGAGEVVGQLAWIDHLLGEQLDARYPGLRARMRHEAGVRVLAPFIQRRDWHWLGLGGDVHNWNPWIHGNVLVAALQFMDAAGQRHERARIIALVIEGLDRYVTSLPIDGAIDEGYAYWWNGACRALEALDILTHATGGVLDPVASIESLRETVAFPHRMHLGGDWYLNLADGQARPPREQPWHSLHRAALRVGDTAARQHAASYREPGAPAANETEGLGRLLRGITDPAWLDAGASSPPLPRDTWLPSTQVLVSREHEGASTGLSVAAKGGHNDEHHNHNDVGSFIIASDGVPVVVDAGRPTYTLATFGPERYSIWTMQSSWHSVPEIRGTAQPAGASARASAVSSTIGDDRSALSLDLAAAYPVPGLKSWRRTASLDRTVSRVTIADDWRLDPWAGDDEPATTVRLLIAGEVELGDGVATIVPLDGAPTLVLRWPAHIAAILCMRPLDDPMLAGVWGESLTRLDLDVTGRDSISITADTLDQKGREAR